MQNVLSDATHYDEAAQCFLMSIQLYTKNAVQAAAVAAAVQGGAYPALSPAAALLPPLPVPQQQGGLPAAAQLAAAAAAKAVTIPYNNLAGVLKIRGRMSEALLCYHRYGRGSRSDRATAPTP